MLPIKILMVLLSREIGSVGVKVHVLGQAYMSKPNRFMKSIDNSCVCLYQISSLTSRKGNELKFQTPRIRSHMHSKL